MGFFMRGKGFELANAMIELNERKVNAEADVIAKRLRVEDVLTYVRESNPSGDLPYHCTFHCVTVAVTAFNLYSAIGKRTRGRQSAITDNARQLFVAGLFHDFNHSGGKLADWENIERAIRGWQNSFADDTTRFGVGRVEEIIQATEFPWKEIPFRHTHNIIRDADFLSSAEIAATLLPIDGLPIELEETLGKRLSPEGMFSRQPDFLNSLRMNTLEGQYLWDQVRPLILKVQRKYVDLC